MISSFSNKKIKNVRALLSSKKERSRQELYVTEGIKLFLEADVSLIKEVYLTEEFSKKEDISEEVLKKLDLTGYETVSDFVFNKISDTVTPQGILCVIKAFEYDLKAFIDNKKTVHVLVLESIQDPGNLGTIIRTAEAAGFDIIIADKVTADIYSPKVIRATMGAIFRVPVIYTDDLYGAVKYLKRQDLKVYAAHLNAEKSFKNTDFSKKCAILIGNEGNGLSDSITKEADELVKIPMHGQAESLNAAVAAALLMYEVSV